MKRLHDESKEEEENKTCWFRKRIFIAIVACIFLITGIAGVTVTCLVLEQKVLKFNHHYGVIFDAGSSHTDVTVYRWPSQYKDRGTAHPKELIFANCSDYGISSFTEEPKKAGEIIEKCINGIVLDVIPHKDVKKTPIYLGATAGMRLLCKRDNVSCDAIMSSIHETFNKFTFRQTKNCVQVLSGQEEALYGWTTANILAGALNGSKTANNDSLIGALDMGGGSIEISFIPKQTNGQQISTLNLYGENYSIYAHSYLCYGFNEAERRLMAHLVEASNDSTEILNPCMNKGYNLTKTNSYVWLTPCSKRPSSDLFPLSNKNYIFIGSGSVKDCDNTLKSLFNKTLCIYQNCTFDGVYQPPLKGKFAAFAGFGKTAKFLNVSKEDSLIKFKKHGDKFCQKIWTEIGQKHKDLKFTKSICFQALYTFQLLTVGLNFDPNAGKVEFMDKINGDEVGWSLGFMVNTTNSIPVESPTYRISQQEFVILLVVSSVLTIIGLAMLMTCLLRRKFSKNLKYGAMVN